MTMGTAATMMIAAEALGFCLPGASSLPAVDSAHRRMARDAGRRAVELAREGLRPADILSAESFDNAVAAVALCGGSTNAVIHLTALARAERGSICRWSVSRAFRRARRCCSI